ncbi:MAG: hypothetical protein WD845_02820 [Pirellulales bacterium]
MESSTLLAFRIFVMLSCLIIVPMAAIFGSAFPDVVKTVLVDRIVHWATGKLPESGPTASADGFSTVAPAPHGDLGRAAVNGSEAPRWGGQGAGASIPVPIFGADHGQAMSATAAGVEPHGDHQQASYIAPVGESPLQGGHGGPNHRSPGTSMPMAEPWGTSAAGEPQADPFTSMERKLREYGATYYLLETWGNHREMFRFHCKMALGDDPNYTRHFEAIDRNALRAMHQVVDRVEAWRAGRVQ